MVWWWRASSSPVDLKKKYDRWCSWSELQQCNGVLFLSCGSWLLVVRAKIWWIWGFKVVVLWLQKRCWRGKKQAVGCYIELGGGGSSRKKNWDFLLCRILPSNPKIIVTALSFWSNYFLNSELLFNRLKLWAPNCDPNLLIKSSYAKFIRNI